MSKVQKLSKKGKFGKEELKIIINDFSDIVLKEDGDILEIKLVPNSLILITYHHHSQICMLL